jgi:hypothetical protein
MNKNLSSYVLVLKDWIDKETCEQTVREIENVPWHKHAFYDVVEGPQKSSHDELDILWHNPSTQFHIMKRVWCALKEYHDHFNFPWYNSWQGFTEVRFNRYKESKMMREHCDHIHTMFDGERKGIPILSILGSLNSEYTGGEFVMWGDESISLDRGSVIIFPSCFLYPHRVEPVTSGTRYSFVSWAW